MAAAVDTVNISEAYPMNGGDGPNSYANNSIRQKGVVDAAKELVSQTIAETLDMDIFLSSKTFNIADLGCSVGPNTFFSVENILESIEFKYHHHQSQGLNSRIPEFQVFFSDHTLNDFNMLFKSLPPSRKYYAVGVPGSFFGRLFPNSSIHLFHSSFAIHWLSRVPRDVRDRDSPAWNKGRIHYSNSKDEVVKAYEAQYAEDLDCFLHARAQESVQGGLVLLTLLGRHNGTPHSDPLGNQTVDILGSCLMDMAREGVVSEEKVDSFNIPTYCASPQELKAAVEQNRYFTIEKLETLSHQVSGHDDVTVSMAKLCASSMRAATEGLIKQQFGEEILDHLFNLYHKKLDDQISIFDESNKSVVFLLVLKRKIAST